MKVSRRADRRIGTYLDQYNSTKTSTKTSSTGELMEIREANTSINLIIWFNNMLMFNEEIP